MRKFKYLGAGSGLTLRKGNEIEQALLKFEKNFFLGKEEFLLTKLKKSFRS